MTANTPNVSNDFSICRDENFESLLTLSRLCDCRHIIEMECIVRCGHTNFKALTLGQQRLLYKLCRDSVTSEAMRAENADTLRRFLQ